MPDQIYGNAFGGNPAENYQQFFVPAIGAPVADDLMAAANLRAGERVLDVACGTGVVTRRAAESVGATGSVAGLDVNPAMLAVARSSTPADLSIDWHQASAESLPLPDAAFDVVLCQMGLQFFPDKPGALREMRRVLDDGGRVLLTMPGPKPRIFAVMAEALARHFGPETAGFVEVVFSMHDGDQIAGLMHDAGFREVDIQAQPKTLRLPAPAEFLWQYINSTPLAEVAAQAGEAKREALEEEVSTRWQEFEEDGAMSAEVRVTTATALK